MQIITDVLNSFDNLFTNDEERMEAEKKLFEVFTKHDAQNLEINKIEARGNWFASGWRPALAYVCVAAFAYSTLLVPVFGLAPIAMASTMEMLTYLLGYSGLRTVEKIKGVIK